MVANMFASLIFLKQWKAAQSVQRSIMLELNRTTKDIKQMSDNINSMKRAAQNQARAGANALYNSTSIFKELPNFDTSAFASIIKGGKVDQEAMKNDPTAANAFNTAMAQANQLVQTKLSQDLAKIEQEIAWMEEMELKPLQDRETDLQAEKITADQQVEIAHNAYKECKENAKNDAKEFFG